jgi:ADP-ribose pyrophosphatase YjhB (NUDIX family)
MEQRYGAPCVLHWQWEVAESDLTNIRASQKHQRAHDITMFIFKGDRLALIRKHAFSSGVYRAPSGGLEPGESYERGAKREAR